MTMMAVTRNGAGRQLAVAGARLFSSATARAVANDSAMAAMTKGLSQTGPAAWTKTSAVFWVQRGYGGVRSRSTVALGDGEHEKEKQAENGTVSASAGVNKDEKGIVSYWGVPPSRITKEDGTEWKWTCFRVRYYFFKILILIFEGIFLFLAVRVDIL